MRITASGKYNKSSCRVLIDALYPIRKTLLLCDILISGIIAIVITAFAMSASKKLFGVATALCFLLLNNAFTGLIYCLIPLLCYHATKELENAVSELDFYDEEFTVKVTRPDGVIINEDCIKYSSIKRLAQKGSYIIIVCDKHKGFVIDKNTLSNNELIKKLKKQR